MALGYVIGVTAPRWRFGFGFIASVSFPDAFALQAFGELGALFDEFRREGLVHVVEAIEGAYVAHGLVAFDGAGGAILGDLLAEAARARKPVRIHVERHNPALRLYERLGFVRIGDTGVYYLMEWSAGGPPETSPTVRAGA